ncbi:hypothetical protein ACH4E8_29580 [Streptomyces sp. NPDC017979]|uniref:hypothetical protein n=1 Tax=Streptomyces sp. NPDC017979 TaxID=3365024 RepID=UPI0037AACC6D
MSAFADPNPGDQSPARLAAIQAVRDHPSTTFMAPYESLADAVLTAARPLIRAEVRAAALREAADALGQRAARMRRIAGSPTEARAAASWADAGHAIRSMAAEAAPAAELVPPAAEDVTVYRASHDSIVMGLYQSAAEARRHCETEERRTWRAGRRATLDWIEDEDEEGGVAELVIEAGGMERTTGYVVEALTVAAVYDEEADE